MSSRDAKTALKAAKEAVKNEDFKEALKLCETVFEADKSCYMAYIFSGLAHLKLGNASLSRQYYKKAIELQPDEKLGWKGLADFYDKQKPITTNELQDALITYQKTFDYLENGDMEKKCLAWSKLALIERKLGNNQEALQYYRQLANSDYLTMDHWLDIVNYLFSIDDKELKLLERGLFVILKSSDVNNEVKAQLWELLILNLHKHYKMGDVSLKQKILSECTAFLANNASYPIMLVLSLVYIDGIIPDLKPCQDVEISKDTFCFFETFYSSTDSDVNLCGSDSMLPVASLCQALNLAATKKWKEAKIMVQKALTLCEGKLLAAHICLLNHEHNTALKHLQCCKEMVRNTPVFLRESFEFLFQLYLAACYVDMKSSKGVSTTLPLLIKMVETKMEGAHIWLSKSYILLGRLDDALSVLEESKEAHSCESHVYLGLKGEILCGKKEYFAALECVNMALERKPTCGEYHLLKGITLWEMSSSDKVEAYSELVQAAKLDPNNGTAFLYLGHYQRIAGNNFVRAASCYKKALELLPSSAEAGLLYGDMLYTCGEMDLAFSVYNKFSADAGPQQKQLWMKMGLYHRKNGDHSAAIQCFQNIILSDPQNRHCWECLGEAYLSRGSLNSAIDSFLEALKLDPKSVNVLYQVANIKKLQGLLFDAVNAYSSVLNLEPAYVPALKGRGESSLAIARMSLKEGFNGRAVNHISLALKDLTKAALLRPNYVCLWKHIGDCCVLLYDLAEENLRVTVPIVLIDCTATTYDHYKPVGKLDIFLIAKRAYGRAIQLSPESSVLWQDLSISHYYLGKLTKDTKYFHIALQLMQKAITLTSNHVHWIGLGVVAHALANRALAQHAFIRSIQIESNAYSDLDAPAPAVMQLIKIEIAEKNYNVVAWTNLGALYLEYENVELAHDAFKCAQSLDPSYTDAWIGQAMIAESIGHNETMDLFRHATELQYHPQAAMGYGYWVCQTLQTIERKLIIEPDNVSLNTVALCAVSQARDALEKYVKSSHKDVCAYNYLGLLYEHEGLLNLAEKAFLSALELMRGQVENDCQILALKFNFARVLSALGKHAEAEKIYYSLASSVDTIGKLDMALALFQGSKLQECVQLYQLVNDASYVSKSVVLSGAAMASYLIDKESCKELLFKAFQTSPPSLHGLVALAVLATLNYDQKLLQATSEEILRVVEWDTSQITLLHPCCGKAISCLLKESKMEGCCKTVASVLSKLPSALTVREDLESSFRVKFYDDAKCSPPLFPQNNVLAYLALEPMQLCGCSSTEVQKAVHMYPSNPWFQYAMVCWLGNHCSELKDKYKAVVEIHVQSILDTMSVTVKYPIYLRALSPLKEALLKI